MDETSLPIDIQCRKLLDWLISRRICNREWHEKICKVREKIGYALKDMPEHPEVRELLSGSNINFFNCIKIVEILKETEKDSKNFFGQYGSQRMTDWKEVLRLYENDNIYIAEASQQDATSRIHTCCATNINIVKECPDPAKTGGCYPG